MAHDHRHETGLDTGSHARPIAITLALVVLYMGVEVIGGVLSGSLALLADAGHMLSDAGALALTLFAMEHGLVSWGELPMGASVPRA